VLRKACGHLANLDCGIWVILNTMVLVIKRSWCSGIIAPSHGADRGSIPRLRKVFLFSFANDVTLALLGALQWLNLTLLKCADGYFCGLLK
jgi:hypothetical protein